MTNTTRQSKKLELQDLMNCLDILCKANAAIVGVNPQLSMEIVSAIETIMIVCNAEQSRKEEELNNFCAKYKKIEEDTITDLFSGEILYEGAD